MTIKDTVVIRGVAHRGDCDPEIAAFVAAAELVTERLPLYPQRHQHVQIGSADVAIEENGDVIIEAAIEEQHVAWLMGFPFLALTIADPKEGPRQIVQAAITDTVLDPLQLPYRIVGWSDDFVQNGNIENCYEPVIVVDEEHVSAINLNQDGSFSPVFDQAKSHVELRHRTETQRLRIPDAIARGCGFETWTEGQETTEASTLRQLLREVMTAL